MIKHLLLAVTAAATLFTANGAESHVLWQADNTEGVTLTWGNGDVNIAPEACSDFTPGGQTGGSISEAMLQQTGRR